MEISLNPHYMPDSLGLVKCFSDDKKLIIYVVGQWDFFYLFFYLMAHIYYHEDWEINTPNTPVAQPINLLLDTFQ